METEETLSEQTEANNVSSKPVEGVSTIAEAMEIEEISEHNQTVNMSEQIKTEKMSEQIVKENISELIETKKMSEQIETEKMYFCRLVERRIPSATVETQQMFSKQPDADKMSMQEDYDMEDKDVICNECDVCKDNHDASANASKRCLKCGQNLCDRCFKDHNRQKILRNHPIVVISCQIEKNAAEPSLSKADNIVEQTVCEDLDSANVSSGCLSTIRAQHHNNGTDGMTQIRRERDRLRAYETEMTNHVDQFLKVQKDINTKADDITKAIFNKFLECITRLERDKMCLLEQLNSQKKKCLSENGAKLEEAIRYLEKLKDREKNLDEIINKGSVDAEDESTKCLLLHIHFQRPISSLANASFHKSSSWTGSENILGRLAGLISITKTQEEPTLSRYRAFLKNVHSLAEDAKKIHWKLTIPNEIEMKNLYDMKMLERVKNELEISTADRKWEALQAKHLRIVSLLYGVSRPTSDSSSEKLESHLTELQRNIERLWNIIEFQIHYKNSEKGLIPEGFQNLGNSAYFNAVLQCLLQTVLLPFELTVNLYGLENVLTEKKELYPLSRAFMELASRYNAPGQRQGFLRTLYSMFKSSAQRFNDQEQHDSHVLLIDLLNKLRVEERNARKIPSTGSETKKVPTAVDRIFGGQFITVYTCLNCKEPYAIREPFLDISIPLRTLILDEQKPVKNKSRPRPRSRSDETNLSSSSGIESSAKEVIKKMLKPIGIETSAEPETKKLWSLFLTSYPTVSQCLSYFTRAEVINDEYLCRNCQTPEYADLVMTSATKRTLISSPPAVLALHLKRFEQKSTGFVKRDEMISYEELLDLGPFCSSSALRIDPEEENVWYSLYAVVVHSGLFLSQGHYVAYIKQRDSSAQLEDQLRERFLQKSFGDLEKVPNDDDLAALEKRKAIKKREKAKRSFPIPGQWFYVSDDTVRRCDAREALDQKAFLLFYERILGDRKTIIGV